MKKARWQIIAFGFSLAVGATGLLFATERTPEHQLYFAVVWIGFACAVAGAQLLYWSNRAGPAQDKPVFVGGTIEHRPPMWGPLLGTMAALTLRVVAAMLIVASVSATLWTVWSALKMPKQDPEIPAASLPAPLTPLTPAPLAEPSLAGVVSVESIVDGDTFDLNGTRVRPLGYDSPERGKQCASPTGPVNVYQTSKDALTELIAGKVVTCVDTGERDRDQRVIARRSVGATDIGEHMVGLGWARDWPVFSKGAYCGIEQQARAAKLGIWGLDCAADVWDGRDYLDPQTGKEC